MICEDVESELEAWGVGLLDRDERREVETHLAYCEACAEQATSLRRILGRLSACPARVDAAGLEDRVLAAALRAPRRPRVLGRILVSAAAGVVLGLFLSAGPEPAPPALVATSSAAPEIQKIAEEPAPPPVEEPAPSPEPSLVDDVPSRAPAESVASLSWEEAAADVSLFAEEGPRVAFALWGLELEPRETLAGGAVHAGSAFAGWSRDDELGGAALIGLCLRF